MALLGITGKKRSGKDTAAQALVFAGYRLFSFASILKAMTFTALERLGVDHDTAIRMVEGDLKEMPVPQLCGQTTRHAMQTLGTEWGRDCIDKDFWVRACIAQAKNCRNAVISDVRFENEAAAVREAGGKVIRINRLTAIPQDTHLSEKMDFDVDHTILNVGTIDDLHGAILAYERRNR